MNVKLNEKDALKKESSFLIGWEERKRFVGMVGHMPVAVAQFLFRISQIYVDVIHCCVVQRLFSKRIWDDKSFA